MGMQSTSAAALTGTTPQSNSSHAASTSSPVPGAPPATVPYTSLDVSPALIPDGVDIGSKWDPSSGKGNATMRFVAPSTQVFELRDAATLGAAGTPNDRVSFSFVNQTDITQGFLTKSGASPSTDKFGLQVNFADGANPKNPAVAASAYGLLTTTQTQNDPRPESPGTSIGANVSVSTSAGTAGAHVRVDNNPTTPNVPYGELSFSAKAGPGLTVAAVGGPAPSVYAALTGQTKTSTGAFGVQITKGQASAVFSFNHTGENFSVGAFLEETPGPHGPQGAAGAAFQLSF